jgi:general secretion pathway protein J
MESFSSPLPSRAALRMPRTELRERGFTLIELVIAMSLLGLILVSLFSGLRLASRSWDAGAVRAEKSNEMRLVQDFIRRAIAQTHPIIWQEATGQPRLSFDGKPHALAFTALLPARAGIGGIYLMKLELRDTRQGKELLLRRRLYRPDGHVKEDGAETTVLVEGVAVLAFGYYGSENSNDPPRWRSEWQSAMQLPKLVRVSLSTDKVWPDIVVPVRNTASSSIGSAPAKIPDDKFFLQ